MGCLKPFHDEAPESVVAHGANHSDRRTQLTELASEYGCRTAKFECAVLNNLLDLVKLGTHIARQDQVNTDVANSHHIELAGLRWHFRSSIEQESSRRADRLCAKNK